MLPRERADARMGVSETSSSAHVVLIEKNDRWDGGRRPRVEPRGQPRRPRSTRSTPRSRRAREQVGAEVHGRDVALLLRPIRCDATELGDLPQTTRRRPRRLENEEQVHAACLGQGAYRRLLMPRPLIPLQVAEFSQQREYMRALDAEDAWRPLASASTSNGKSRIRRPVEGSSARRQPGVRPLERVEADARPRTSAAAPPAAAARARAVGGATEEQPRRWASSRPRSAGSGDEAAWLARGARLGERGGEGPRADRRRSSRSRGTRARSRCSGARSAASASTCTSSSPAPPTEATTAPPPRMAAAAAAPSGRTRATRPIAGSRCRRTCRGRRRRSDESAAGVWVPRS